MRILGLSAYYHDSAAALVVDGRIVAAAQEERFTRKKHDSRYPSNAIAYCLEAGGIAAGDVDHVVVLFRRDGHWGAISKSNSPFLRYRDPIYRSLRELAMSFFPHYVKRRRKTLRGFSMPVDLRRHAPSHWVTRPGFCREMVDELTAARHFPLLPPRATLRPIDAVEARANLLRDHEA